MSPLWLTDIKGTKTLLLITYSPVSEKLKASGLADRALN